MGGRSVRSLRCARLVASKGSCGCSAELPSGSFLRLTALTCRLQWSAMRDEAAVRYFSLNRISRSPDMFRPSAKPISPAPQLCSRFCMEALDASVEV